MPYATNGRISTDPIDGGVEISQEQYLEALVAIGEGKLIVVDEGFAFIDPPEPEIEPEPNADPVPQQMTFAQLLIGLVAEEWVTETEGEAWLAGQLPAAVTSLIATLPSDQRFAALARASRPSIVLRSDPLVNALANLQGKADDMDDFFSTYAAV